MGFSPQKPSTQVEIDQYEMFGDDRDADIRELKTL